MYFKFTSNTYIDTIVNIFNANMITNLHKNLPKTFKQLLYTYYTINTRCLLVTIINSNPANVISENHGVSSEYLNFFFCPSIIYCVQFEFMMTYFIFATRETIF